MGGLATNTSRESLRGYFEKFGTVQDSILMVDRVSGRSRCFGFITMQDPSTLDTILSQTHTLDGKKVDCKKAVPREQGHNQPVPVAFKTKKMFVGGLPPDVDDQVFRTFFEQFGEVEDSVVILDKETGRPRGFGFITFVSEDTPDLVLENYEKNCINGKWVECKKATPREGQNNYSNFSSPYMMYSPYYYDSYSRQEYSQNLMSSFNYLNPLGQSAYDTPQYDAYNSK